MNCGVRYLLITRPPDDSLRWRYAYLSTDSATVQWR